MTSGGVLCKVQDLGPPSAACSWSDVVGGSTKDTFSPRRRNSSETQSSLMPSPLLHISPGPGFLFFLPYSKTSVSHLVIITSDFFNNFLSSSRPFVQMGWVKGGQKNFHTKTFLCNLTRKARNWSEQKSQLKFFFSKWVYKTSYLLLSLSFIQ